MKTQFHRIFMALTLLIGGMAHGAAITWTNISGGFWHVPENWSPNQVPRNTDNALITTPGNYTVIFDAPIHEGSFSMVSNLTVGAGSSSSGVQTLLATNLSTNFPFEVSALMSITMGGVFDMTNGALNAGALALNQGGIVNAANEILPGPLLINKSVMNSTGGILGQGDLSSLIEVSNGVLNVNGDQLESPIRVGVYSRLTAMNTSIELSLTLDSHSVLNLTGTPSNSVSLSLFGPFTNGGIINMTNSTMEIFNDNMLNQSGALLNEPGGMINFWDTNISPGLGSVIVGDGPLINQGQIIRQTGAGASELASPFATNAGVISVRTGEITMGGTWTLPPESSLDVRLNSAGNFGSFSFPTNLNLGGTFQVTLGNGYVPTNNSFFSVLSYGSMLGNFSTLILPSTVSWLPFFSPTNLALTVGIAEPQFTSASPMENAIVFSGARGSPGSEYVVLASVSLDLPVTDWIPLATNVFDAAGRFWYTNAIISDFPRQFFILKTP